MSEHEGQRAYQQYQQDTGNTQMNVNVWKPSSNGFEGTTYDQLTDDYKKFLERKTMKVVHEDPFNHKQYMFGVNLNPDGGARAWRKEYTPSAGGGTGSKAFYLDCGVTAVSTEDANNILMGNENTKEYRYKLMNSLVIQRGVGQTDIVNIVLKQKRIEFG